MKLNEITTEQHGFLKSESSIMHWLASYTDVNRRDITISNGCVDVDSDVNVNSNVKSLGVQFGTVNGLFNVEAGDYSHRSALTSLRGAPRTVTGASEIDVSFSMITSLEGVPKCDVIAAASTEITRIEDVFPYLQGPVRTLSLSYNRITSLAGIADMVKFPIQRIVISPSCFDDGGIGLILVPGLRKIYVNDDDDYDYNPHSNAIDIIKKYLGRPDDIFDCQAELIENGFDKNAIL